MHEAMLNGHFISLAGAAKQLGTTRDYLNVLIHRGKLHAVKLARNWVTTQEWVDSYLDAKNPERKIERLQAVLEMLKQHLEDARARDLERSREAITPIEQIEVLKEAFLESLSPEPGFLQPNSYNLQAVPPVPYTLLPLHSGGIHFVARNAEIRIANSEWRIALSAFATLILAGVAFAYPSALTLPSQAGLHFGESAIALVQHAAALELPVKIEGDYILVSIPELNIMPALRADFAFLYNTIASIPTWAEASGLAESQVAGEKSPP